MPPAAYQRLDANPTIHMQMRFLGSTVGVADSGQDSKNDRRSNKDVRDQRLKEKKPEQLSIASESGGLYSNGAVEKPHKKNNIDADPFGY
jgi:hypothetical protein